MLPDGRLPGGSRRLYLIVCLAVWRSK